MKKEADLGACIGATAALIGLPLLPEHRPGVLRYFGIAAGLAALVMAHPLSSEDETGALFAPVPPPEGPTP